jgi:hypothetical protein
MIMMHQEDSLKALVTFAIEKTLLDIGKPEYETVSYLLYERYQRGIPDCFEKPEYLKEVLRELYGTSHNEIIKSIEQELKEVIENKKVEVFLQVLL